MEKQYKNFPFDIPEEKKVKNEIEIIENKGKRKLWIIILVVLVLLIFGVIGNKLIVGKKQYRLGVYEGLVSKTNDGWLLYKNEEYGFEIKFPNYIPTQLGIDKPISDGEPGKHGGPSYILSAGDAKDLPPEKLKGVTFLSIGIIEPDPSFGYPIIEHCIINKDYPESKYYLDLTYKDEENFPIVGKESLLIYCYTDKNKVEHEIHFISPEINNKYKIVLTIEPIKNEEGDRYEEIIKQIISLIKFTK